MCIFYTNWKKKKISSSFCLHSWDKCLWMKSWNNSWGRETSKKLQICFASQQRSHSYRWIIAGILPTKMMDWYKHISLVFDISAIYNAFNAFPCYDQYTNNALCNIISISICQWGINVLQSIVTINSRFQIDSWMLVEQWKEISYQTKPIDSPGAQN